MLRHLSRRLVAPNFRTYASKPSTKKQQELRVPLITCKVAKYDQYQGQRLPQNVKFGDIPLASSGWEHYRAKGDHFIIHPTDFDQVNSGGDVEKSFADLDLNEKVVENLKLRLDVNNPCSIQSETIPRILGEDHTLIAAETGCGKTLAYLIPIVQRILLRKQEQEDRPMNTPLAIILTPGRELATQIGTVAEKLCSQLDIQIKTILGGSTKQKMMNPEFESIDILVGSMGTISKLVTTGIYRMHEVRHVVIDEADTMFDDSFNDKLVYFLKRFPFHRNHMQDINDNIIGTQLIVVSATMPTNMEELLQSVIDTSTIHEVVSPNLHRILPNIKQTFMRMSKMHRSIQMLSLIKTELAKNRPVIVFSNKSVTCDYVSMFLNDHDIKSACLNGDMLAKIRAGQFSTFQNGEVHVLSTTDVASRGLDTTRARHIINYDFPLYISDYIHRIGRIGRIGSDTKCQVTNFVSSFRELRLVQKIEHTARTAGVLPNVNANIGNIIAKKIIKELDAEEKELM